MGPYRRAEPGEPKLAELRGHFRSIAVTGTNGKSSTTWMVASVLAQPGKAAGRMSTLGAAHWNGDRFESLSDFRALLMRARARRREHDEPPVPLALEVTSKALAEGFAQTWRSDVAIFTNFTRDHLDYHGSPEHYLAAKAQLFLLLARGGQAVLNHDDPSSQMIVRAMREAKVPARVPQTFSTQGARHATLRAEQLAVGRRGTTFRLDSKKIPEISGAEVSMPVIGRVQVENALGAILGTLAAGEAPAAILAGLARFAGVPGRFQVVAREPFVVVDYAHTPDGLDKTLLAARELVGEGGELRVVFGAGGERDQGKRAPMGAVADLRADAVWLTSDNPRRESAARIAAMVEGGRRKRSTTRWTRELDRRKAIAAALAGAGDADVIVVAGKGHEREQQIGTTKHPFDDVEVVRAVTGPRT